MSDRWIIISGLVVFLALISFPLWARIGSAASSEPPDLELPAGKTRCVETKSYMIGNHMRLLDAWRDSVVRKGKTTYTSLAYGDKYKMSLTGTCLKCHEHKDRFCDRCHTYANVSPYCWDCHMTPGKKQ